MSTNNGKTEREYILNVAQQLLQGITKPHFNPLTNETWFHTICNMNGHDTYCFYGHLASDAEEFLRPFRGPALQRIICASIPGGDSYVIPKDEKDGPVKTPMWVMCRDKSSLLTGNGLEILRNIAAIALVAAAYDLCYARHHQNGVRPI